MSAPKARTIVDTAPERDAAYAIASRMARVLRGAGITERYGVSVRPMHTATLLVSGWGVYLTDRYPDQPRPAGSAAAALSQWATAA